MIAKADLHKWFGALRQTMLTVVLEPGRLLAWRCTRLGLGGWQVDRREEFALEQAEPSGDVLVGLLRPLLLRWALTPGTPVVLVLPPQLGGALSLMAPEGAKGREWIGPELSRLLPFVTKELDFGATLRTQEGKTAAEVVWVPRGWLGDVRSAFGKLGLKLDEVLSRGQLLAPEAVPPSLNARWQECLAAVRRRPVASAPLPVVARLEVAPAYANFHCYRGPALLRSRRLSLAENASDTELAAAVALELFSLDADGVRVDALSLSGASPALRELLSDDFRGAIHYQAEADDLAAAFCAAWARDVHGIWLMPAEKREVFASLYKTGYVIAGVGTVLAVALSMAASSAEEESGQLDSDIRRLKPKYQKVMAVESQAVDMSRLVAAIDANAAAPLPLDALYGVYEALPESAWITRFSWRADGALVLAGRGLSSAEALKRLQTVSGFIELRVGAEPTSVNKDAAAKDGTPSAPPASPAPLAAAAPTTAAAVPPVAATAGDSLSFLVEGRWRQPAARPAGGSATAPATAATPASAAAPVAASVPVGAPVTAPASQVPPAGAPRGGNGQPALPPGFPFSPPGGNAAPAR